MVSHTSGCREIKQSRHNVPCLAPDTYCQDEEAGGQLPAEGSEEERMGILLSLGPTKFCSCFLLVEVVAQQGQILLLQHAKYLPFLHVHF